MTGFTDNSEEIPYRSIPTAPEPQDAVEIDEEDYSTLLQIRRNLSQDLENLKYDLTEVDTGTVRDLKVEIRSRQKAYEIIEPIYQAVKEAVDKVELTRKGSK